MEPVRKRRVAGKELFDATESMDIRVTRRDLKKAKTKDPMSCALAQGCLHDKHVLSARIGVKIALIEMDDRVIRFSVTPEDAKKIRAFDNANYFQPGTYTLHPPITKLGVHTRGHGRKGNGVRGKNVYRQAPLRHVQRVSV